MATYNSNVDTDNYNITINGMDFIMEDPSPNEAFNRRELARHDIIGGTQHTIRTVYKVRDYSFRLHLRIDPKYPDIYNEMFTTWVNTPCEIICSYMGGKFNAEVSVKPVPVGNYLECDVQVIEIPTTTSSIPNDSLDSPSDKHFEIISTDNTDKLRKEISECKKQYEEALKEYKKHKTKKNKEKVKNLKNKLDKLEKKLNNSKSKTVKTSDTTNITNKNKDSKNTKKSNNNLTKTKKQE